MIQECAKFFIFFGAPGSGKGSLAGMCVERLGWRQLSTGNLFRKHISEGTELGNQIDFAIKSGKLVDDEVVVKMVAGWVFENISSTKAIILDGFPRTLVQAQIFMDLLKKDFPNASVSVVKLEISDEKVIARLSSRRTCQKCNAIYSVVKESERGPQVDNVCDSCESILVQRNDDKPETIVTRLEVYHKHAGQLLRFYEQLGVKIETMNVEKTLDKVFENFITLVGDGSDYCKE